MKKEMIMKEFENRGYQVENFIKISNGVELEGFVIKIGTVSPIIYTKKYIEEALLFELSVSQVVDKILDDLDSNKLDFNISSIENSNFILDHAFIAVQKTSHENIVKRDSIFEGIEEYIYISISHNYSCKMSKKNLSHYNFSEDDLWKIAEKNSRNDITISNMSELLGGILSDDVNLPIYVVSNNSKCKGAYGALDKEFIKKFALDLGVSGFAVLPSSIHEMLLYPFHDISEIDMNDLNQVVYDVNHMVVDPEERLTDRAYLYEF